METMPNSIDIFVNKYKWRDKIQSKLMYLWKVRILSNHISSLSAGRSLDTHLIYINTSRPDTLSLHNKASVLEQREAQTFEHVSHSMLS